MHEIVLRICVNEDFTACVSVDEMLPPPVVTRRVAATLLAAAASGGLDVGQAPRAALAAKPKKCTDIETCREMGEAAFEAKEAARGPLVRLGEGISYRESVKGSGDAVIELGDVLEITFNVYTGSGNYQYGLPSREPGSRESGQTYRVVMGQRDVPVAIERALIGARRGSSRLIEMPPQSGFGTSNWQPAPTSFAGKQRMERYRQLLTGNGLQPGYNAVLLFEVDVQNIRKRQGSA